MNKNTFKATIAGVAGVCLALASAHANTITLGVGLSDPYAIGDVVNGIQPGGQADRDVIMVNNLISLALGTQSSTMAGDVGDLYQRTANNFGTLPTAIATGNQLNGGLSFSGGLLTLTLPQGFTYLVVAYDGPNGGAEIYDVAGIAAGTTLTLPQNAAPTAADGSLQVGDKYQMTGWTFLNADNTTHTHVPDGASTVGLLGAALAGLGLLRRKFRH